MSVYSGFSTRQQEATYNRLTESMLLLLKDRIFSAERQEPAPDSFWLEQFVGVYGQMSRMEAHKYFPPKLTQCVKDLASAYGAGDWEEQLSLSTERKKPRTVVTKHRYGRSESRHLNNSLLGGRPAPSQDLFVPVSAVLPRPRRKKRMRAKPKPSFHQMSDKQTIEWADLKPRSRNYYSGLMLKKLASPGQGSFAMPWKDF